MDKPSSVKVNYSMLVKDLVSGQLKKIKVRDCIQILPKRIYDSFNPVTCDWDKKATYARLKTDSKTGEKKVYRIKILEMRETMKEIEELEPKTKNPVLAVKKSELLANFKNAAEAQAAQDKKKEKEVRKRSATGDVCEEYEKKKRKTESSDKKTQSTADNNIMGNSKPAVVIKEPVLASKPTNSLNDGNSKPAVVIKEATLASKPTNFLNDGNSKPAVVIKEPILASKPTNSLNDDSKGHDKSSKDVKLPHLEVAEVVTSTASSTPSKTDELMESDEFSPKNEVNDRSSSEHHPKEDHHKNFECVGDQNLEECLEERLTSIDNNIDILLNNQQVLKEMLDDIRDKLKSPAELRMHPLWEMPKNAVCIAMLPPKAHLPEGGKEGDEENLVYIGCQNVFLKRSDIECIVYLKDEILQKKVKLLACTMVGKKGLKNYCLKRIKEDQAEDEDEENKENMTRFPDDFVAAMTNLINHGIVKTNYPGETLVLISEELVRDKLRKVLYTFKRKQ